MQSLILFVGVMVFVFYQFNAPPIFFNQAELARAKQTPFAGKLIDLERAHRTAFERNHSEIWQFDRALDRHDAAAIAASEQRVRAAETASAAIRDEAKRTIGAALPDANTRDADYIFLTFVMRNLPRRVVGLLIVVIFCAAMSAVAGELSALASTTVVDFYRRSLRKDASDAHYVRAAKWITAGWGVLAVLFATFASLLDNLIQAVNILGSLFYGTILGIFLVAFSNRVVRGTAVFLAAIAAEAIVVGVFLGTSVSFLWYNVIGCACVVLFSGVLQVALPRR
jgi:SSS family solute:Na+ symporter